MFEASLSGLGFKLMILLYVRVVTGRPSPFDCYFMLLPFKSTNIKELVHCVLPLTVIADSIYHLVMENDLAELML